MNVHQPPSLRAAREWAAFLARTAGFGTVSLTLGPVTPRHGASRWAMRRWCVSCCDAFGIEREVLGADVLRSAPQCVLIANHLSLIDILVLGAFIERDYRWLAKDKLFKIPFIGWHLALSGHVPVYRRDRSRNRDLPARLSAAVAEGASLLFFPEGTRSPDGRLQTFRLGAFRAAVADELPVVPLVVRGTREVLAKGRAALDSHARRRCTVTALPPIHPPAEGSAEERAQQLLDAAHAAFARELGEDR